MLCESPSSLLVLPLLTSAFMWIPGKDYFLQHCFPLLNPSPTAPDSSLRKSHLCDKSLHSAVAHPFQFLCLLFMALFQGALWSIMGSNSEFSNCRVSCECSFLRLIIFPNPKVGHLLIAAGIVLCPVSPHCMQLENSDCTK